MPPAIIPIVAETAGGAAAGAGGKKGGGSANDAAAKQLQVQQQQLQFGREVYDKSLTAWQPAKDYWTALLSGNPTLMAGAVGPTADAIQRQGATRTASITNLLPAGGEKNLALASNTNDIYNNLARLYSGVQPTAATALGQLSVPQTSAGVSLSGQAAPAVGSAIYAQQAANSQKSQTGGALGGGLGQLIYNHKNQQQNDSGGSSKGGGTPPYTPKGGR